MSRHCKALDTAIPEALAILASPMATIYNTEGHVSIYGQDGTTSVNVWHCPLLRKPGCTEIHTHQFHGCSTILLGRIDNAIYAVAGGDDEGGDEVDLVKMVPGQWQAAGALRLRLTGHEQAHHRGESYCIAHGALHRAVSPGLAITLFRRSEVDLTEPITMQIGGKLGTGGISWTPGEAFIRLLPAINFAARELLADEHAPTTRIEALLADASALVGD